MGNATRCEALINNLKSDFDIDVLTSDKALFFFKNNKKARSVFSQQDLNLKLKYPYGSIKFFVSYAKSFISRIFKNYKIQKNIIDSHQYDYIIFDSDYGFILHKIFGRRNLVGLNNAYEVVKFYKETKKNNSANCLSYFLERLDYLVHLLFLDLIICPGISFEDVSVHRQIILTGPLFVREELLLSAERRIENSILILPSASGEKSSLQRFSSYLKSQKNVYVIDNFEMDNLDFLRKADILLCNAGQSSVAEALYLQKRAVLFPIPKHSEQKANAELAQKRGLLVYNDQKAEDLFQQIKEYYAEEINMKKRNELADKLQKFYFEIRKILNDKAQN